MILLKAQWEIDYWIVFQLTNQGVDYRSVACGGSWNLGIEKFQMKLVESEIFDLYQIRIYMIAQQ